MTFLHGRTTEVLLDGADISTYLNAADLSVDVDTADTTTFKATWKTAIPGQVAAAAEFGGLYDTASIATFTALIGDDPGAVLTVVPASQSAVGDPCRLIKIASTAHKETAPVGGVVAFNWSAVADGAVGFGHVLAPLAAVTADGNGTTHTGPLGGTTTGAIAHLHVTSVSAGDSIDVTIEHSTNGTDWATLGTFAQKSAAGAERLVIAGTVNRYTRAVFNVTGTDVSITCAVALART